MEISNLRKLILMLLFLSSFQLCKAFGGVVNPLAKLRFDGKNGEFRILQVADMHYGDGKTTPCEDVLPKQMSSCSDLNTTDFIFRMIHAEKPHLIVFTGKHTLSLARARSVSSIFVVDVHTLRCVWLLMHLYEFFFHDRPDLYCIDHLLKVIFEKVLRLRIGCSLVVDEVVESDEVHVVPIAGGR